MVRDDWFVTSSLFPHPLLKSHILRKGTDPSFAFPLAQNLYGVSSNKNKTGMSTLALCLITAFNECNLASAFFCIFPPDFTAQFSEAWRDELKDLAAKVSLSSQGQKDKKEVFL